LAENDSDTPKSEGRGRPKRLTREVIVRTAARIPPEDFSLLKLAEMLGVSSQSLYHYFPSKEAISKAIALEIAAEVPEPSSELGWREYMRQTALLYRKWLLGNDFPIARSMPNSRLSLFRAGSDRSEVILNRLDTFVAVLRRDGFTLGQAVAIWSILTNHIRRSDLHRATQENFDMAWGELIADIGESQEGEFPELRALEKGPVPNFERFYIEALEILLDGISSRYGIK
jgi:AcrR family transcriptional regulator